MKRTFRVLFVLLTALAVAVGAGLWHARSKLPQRSGTLQLHALQAPVQVNWDERGVPHLQARNQTDLYRALGFLHAQDRLFQMEMVRRLARGELAEILGPKLLDTDRLFRTLELRAQAEVMAQRIDHNSPTWQALSAYLDGINQFQATRPVADRIRGAAHPNRGRSRRRTRWPWPATWPTALPLPCAPSRC